MKEMMLKLTPGLTSFSVLVLPPILFLMHILCILVYSNLSDYLPLLFNFHINCAAAPSQSSSSSSSSPSLALSGLRCLTLTSNLIASIYLSQHIPKLPLDILTCANTACSQHHMVLDEYADKLVSTLIACSKTCLPTRSPSFRTVANWME